jgi:hypothetical protein
MRAPGHEKACNARSMPLRLEFVVAAFALTTLLLAQWMLSTAIHATNYYGLDGKMAQSTVLALLKFGGLFDINNITPLEGVGSQMLTKNAWANPSLWPFIFLDKELATDVSALIALGCFAVACYVMARCFSVPVLPSALAAQLCVLLFAPALLIAHMPTNFCLTPADAVVYAPVMPALGLLVRLQPGSWHRFLLTTGGIFALLIYSLYCDPLWIMVAGISWTVPYVVVTLGPLRLNTILLRGAALACCLALFLLSGAIEYLYTLSQYTARVQFAHVFDRERAPVFVSAVTYSPNMKYFYLAVGLGWLVGLLTLRGRQRLLVVAGVAGFGFYLAYGLVYLLIPNAVWLPPIPIYIEQCLFPLYVTGALAGYWGALRWLSAMGIAAAEHIGFVDARAGSLFPSARGKNPSRTRSLLAPSRIRAGAGALGLAMVATIPAWVAEFALNKAAFYAETFHLPWPDEPELTRFFGDNIGLQVGGPFRGSVNVWLIAFEPGFTVASLWANGIPTIDEYSQLVSPQSVYFVHKLINKDVRRELNGFVPNLLNSSYSDAYWKALQLFGVRYNADTSPLKDEFNPGFPLITLPFRPYSRERPEGLWYVYELPRPNTGNYSPTEVVMAQTGADIVATIAKPDFDPMKHVVISTALRERLVPARDMRLSLIRGGLHVSGKSDGTSLVVLPQQFSNCLRARDFRVRLVRADLMMTGLIFSGDLDTDILFDYGILTPRCRRLDLADMHSLDLRINLRMPHLSVEPRFLDWSGAWARLRAAATAIQ